MSVCFGSGAPEAWSRRSPDDAGPEPAFVPSALAICPKAFCIGSSP
jgi:hypothetical protein